MPQPAFTIDSYSNSNKYYFVLLLQIILHVVDVQREDSMMQPEFLFYFLTMTEKIHNACCFKSLSVSGRLISSISFSLLGINIYFQKFYAHSERSYTQIKSIAIVPAGQEGWTQFLTHRNWIPSYRV